MPATHEQIRRFVQSVRQRLGARALAQAAVWSLLVGSAAMLAIALVYVAQGYAVERYWYGLVTIAIAVAATIGWLATRASNERAARFADSFFELHDALISWWHFSRQHKTDGFYELQAAQTAARVNTLDAQQIAWQPSRAPLMFALALTVFAIALGAKQPSAAVVERQELAAAVLAGTETINEELQQLVEELQQGASDQERELIEPDRLREMVEQLATTSDQKEALRQYAKLENKLQETSAKLQQRHDEHLLQAAAKELDKARETKPLAEKLAQKKYDEAAEELASSQPDAKKPLTEQQKDLAKLRAAGQRMAAAAKSAGRSGASGSSASSQQNSSQSGKGSSGGSGASGSGSSGAGGELEQSIQDLDSALGEQEAALAEAARQEKANGKCDADSLAACSNCQQNSQNKLDKLTKHMKRMTIKREASEKLCKLCEACSQCQSGLCKGTRPGGKNAGSGTNDSRRDASDDLVDNGQTEALQGIKGAGPSQTSVEAAEDGTATAHRAGPAPARAYRRQFESFVSREDVPEQVKSGVRNYFESIHKIEEPR